MSDDVLGRIAGWCLADPKLTFVEEGPAVEVAGEPPLHLDLAVTGEEVLLSHRLSLAGAGEGALTRAMALVNRRGSLLRGTAEAEGDGLAVGIEYPVYLDGLTRQNFLLATQELAAAADAVAGLGTVTPAAKAPEPEVVMEPAAFVAPIPVVADTIEMPASPPQPAAAAFAPTHEAPAGGMSAWASPDPNLQPVARLEARVQLRVDERRGAWARVTGANGWTGWVDDRRLSPLGGAPAATAAPAVTPAYAPTPVYAPTPMPVTAPQPAVWAATHQAPTGGLPAWASPDPSAAPIAELAARVQLRIEETRGDWARVSGSNGWTGWVDARRLGPLGRSGGGGLALGGLALRPLPLVGAIALIVATFLSWIKATGITGSVGGWDVGLPILWNIDNPGDQPRIGLILLIVGIIGLAAAFIPRAGRGLAAFTGLLSIVIGGLYALQVIRFFDRLAGATAGDTLSHAIGIGPWVALAGGLLLLIGAMLPERRS
ncbi:MAG: SH3 domain-containing protein [Actinomycetota bacterium]